MSESPTPVTPEGAPLLSVDTMLRRSDAVVSTEAGARTSMMDIVKGQYFGLEDVGARVWALLESPRSMGDIRDRLVLEFEVDVSVCEAELRPFLRTLLDEGLLDITEV
jgi:hypothetical protein